MKRNPAFHPLSREHHDGLLLAIRLQQGERALPRLWSHDRAWQAEFVVRFYNEHLRRHFLSEEEQLFPVAEGKSPAELRKLAGRLRDDHAWMNKTITELPAADRSLLEELLPAFGKRLEEHIRTEERTFFPMCERWFTHEELARVGEYLSAHHPQGNRP
jgi:hemerythrin-like domain-containing protein